jgi:MFS superfamily sulfate permease-like transporter
MPSLTLSVYWIPPSVSGILSPKRSVSVDTVSYFKIANSLLHLAALACYVALVVEMFKHDESGWAIACILLFCCGCGQLLAFIYGWTKVGEWDISLLMMAYSLCILAGIVQVALWVAKLGPSSVGM